MHVSGALVTPLEWWPDERSFGTGSRLGNWPSVRTFRTCVGQNLSCLCGVCPQSDAIRSCKRRRTRRSMSSTIGRTFSTGRSAGSSRSQSVWRVPGVAPPVVHRSIKPWLPTATQMGSERTMPFMGSVATSPTVCTVAGDRLPTVARGRGLPLRYWSQQHTGLACRTQRRR